MKRKIALLFLLLAADWLIAETATFTHVRIHRHRDAQRRMLPDREGVLTFDDVNRRITFYNIMLDRFDEQIKFEAPYDRVTKVVFDSTTHERGEGKFAALNFASLGGIVAASAIGARLVQDNWLYLEYKDGKRTEQTLLRLPNESVANVKQKAADTFADRVVVSAFAEHSEEIPRKQLRSAEFRSRYDVTLNKRDHPLPPEKADKATIIVVCPMVGLNIWRGSHVKLHANDRVVAVNEMGTYSFAYLDPGTYRLISRSPDNNNGFQMDLEANKTYYFLQNSLAHGRTVLSRNSAEVVTFLAADMYLSEWKPE